MGTKNQNKFKGLQSLSAMLPQAQVIETANTPYGAVDMLETGIFQSANSNVAIDTVETTEVPETVEIPETHPFSEWNAYYSGRPLMFDGRECSYDCRGKNGAQWVRFMDNSELRITPDQFHMVTPLGQSGNPISWDTVFDLQSLYEGDCIEFDQQTWVVKHLSNGVYSLSNQAESRVVTDRALQDRCALVSKFEISQTPSETVFETALPLSGDVVSIDPIRGFRLVSILGKEEFLEKFGIQSEYVRVYDTEVRKEYDHFKYGEYQNTSNGTHIETVKENCSYLDAIKNPNNVKWCGFWAFNSSVFDIEIRNGKRNMGSQKSEMVLRPNQDFTEFAVFISE
jgi:hypothetical protein